MRQHYALVVGAVVILTAACADETGAPTTPSAITSPSVTTVTAEESGTAAIEADKGGDARAKFYKRNHASWVGKAHNKALADFSAMLRKKGPRHDLCLEVLEFMSEPERLPESNRRASRGQLRQHLVQHMSGTKVCRGRFLAETPSVMGFANTLSTVFRAARAGGLSPAATSLVDQIDAQVLTAASPADLAVGLLPILAQADNLGSLEREIIYASASVAQSSVEYWDANLMTEAAQVDASHGECLGQYAERETAVRVCMGIQQRPIPTSFRSYGPRPWVNFAQDHPCYTQYYSGRTIAREDLAGAVVGGVWGLGGGIFGIASGAVAVGGGASALESWGQLADYVWCRRSGGGAGTATRPKQT